MSGVKKTECMVLDCIGLPNKTGVSVWCAYETMSKYVQHNDMTNYLLTPGVCHSAVCSIEVEGACERVIAHVSLSCCRSHLHEII